MNSREDYNMKFCKKLNITENVPLRTQLRQARSTTAGYDAIVY
jgi:hypothetical protein